MHIARKIGLLLVMVLVFPVADAGTVSAQVGRITKVMTYTTFGDGDVAVWTEYQAPGCDGFWFRTTERNGKEIYAQLIAAQHTEKSVGLVAYDDQLWTGTASRFCRIYALSTDG
jgi:hypothetical protein